jgi:peptidoglycan/xylan/chitin deacetylase (PgdA/CDA1 family)
VPAGSSFIVCLTHDIDHAGIRNHKLDHTALGFLYRATIGSLINVCRGRRAAGYLAANWMAAFSLPLVYLGISEDFWNHFGRYTEIEKDLNSTFFVIPKKGDAGQTTGGPAPARRATRYDAAQIVDDIQQLIAADREIGVHGIDAWLDNNKGRIELETIHRLTGQSQIGVRMHWLFYDENSPAKLEEAGFSYDSTLGYNETVGYRAGTTQAFKPLGLAKMMELPMHIMDTALFFPGRMNLSPSEAESVVNAIIADAKRFGGVLTINWHDRSIAPERLWGDFYVKMLDQLKELGATFLTAAQTVAWFRKRRSITFEDISREGDKVRVTIAMDDQNADLPGLRMRAYRPIESGKTEIENAFTETTISRAGEVEIPV